MDISRDLLLSFEANERRNALRQIASKQIFAETLGARKPITISGDDGDVDEICVARRDLEETLGMHPSKDTGPQI